MKDLSPAASSAPARQPAYGWVIVAACSLMIFITYGLIYSYSVFFKPLAEHFQWDRATVSMVYSLAVIIRGAVSIGAGWLADRFGPRKLLIGCGLFMGAGYLLASQVTALWQFFLAYAVVEAIGMSGIFGVGTALVSQWFTRNRGLALGIVASGSGLGTFLIVPGAERLVAALDWDGAFVVCGIAAGVLMILGASFLKRPPQDVAQLKSVTPQKGTPVAKSLRDSRLYLIMFCFLLFFFGTQMIMVHLVNHATDQGIDPLVAATFMSVIGIISIAGRLSIGVLADRIGVHLCMVISGLCLIASFVLALFTTTLWGFYLFAVIFSIPYGGEVTLIPLVIGRYFGTRAMATLMGFTIFVIGLGGALGAWVAGRIFDVTGSYQWAFIIGAVFGTGSLILVWILKQKDNKKPGN